jgi:alkanesulfonate monooxygenase SsuD/methylene tetrahydromethanopterin reductase-like flavin-dependent oxidoreductase (luciferase family)
VSPIVQRRLGVMFDRDLPPEELTEWCGELDGRADDIWVVEDLGWAGGMTSAALALAATQHVRVGIGIAPAPLRNPVLLAMEISTLGRAHPGRFAAGIGHGVSPWMRDAGAMPASQLALLEETIVVVRSLLRGEEVSLDGREVHVRSAKLVHPPEAVPPVLAGVVKPKSLRISGQVADGTVLIEGTGPDGIRRAVREIGKEPSEHELVVYAYSYVDEDPERVRAATERTAIDFAGFLGVAPEDVFLVAGSPDDAAAKVEALWAAGAAAVVLHPLGDDLRGQARRALAALGR